MAWFFVAAYWYGGNANNIGKTYYQAQAVELLQKGVNPQNEIKAIEILLALQSDYRNQQIPPSKPSGRFWLFLVVGGLLCLALSFPPELVVGLGKGEKELARWQSWIKFVSITVPAFLASTYLWPTLTTWLRALIK